MTHRPLYAYVAALNIGSIRVLEKCGFVLRGEEEFTSGGARDLDEVVIELEGGERT